MCKGPDKKQEYAQEDVPSKTVNGEQPNTGLHGKLETIPLSMEKEVQSAGMSEERLMDHWDLPLQHTQATTRLHHQVFDLNLNEVKPAETSSSVQHPDASGEDTLTQVVTEPGRIIPVEPCIPAGLEQPEVSEVQAPLPTLECWDEYTENLLERTEASVLDLRSLLSDGAHQADKRPEETEPEESQTCWHISTGPGLASVAHCPLLKFPSMSYYPSFQNVQPLEGELTCHYMLTFFMLHFGFISIFV